MCRPIKSCKAKIVADLQNLAINATIVLKPPVPRKLASKRGFSGTPTLTLGLMQELERKPAVNLNFEWAT